MTRHEKRKWAIAAILAVVLAGVLWSQYGPSGSTSQTVLRARTARQTASGSAVAGGAPINEAALTAPADLEEIRALNPFDASRIIPLATAAAPQQASDASTPSSEESAELIVPDWLRTGKIQGRLRVGGDDMIVVNGRLLRVGDVVDGVEIVRIQEDAVWVRKPGRSGGL